MRELQATDTINYWQSSFNKVASEGLEGAFTNDYDLNSGLDFFVRGGVVRQDNQFVDVNDTTVTLADNTTNIVYLDKTLGAEQILSSDEASAPASYLHIHLFRVVTSSGAITSITDLRSWIHVLTALDHNALRYRDEPNAHQRYEYDTVFGNVMNASTHIPLKKPNDAISLRGELQCLRESPGTYVDIYGILQKTDYYTGTPSYSDSISIKDSTATFVSLDGYMIYLTDNTNEAYRWVDAWTSTKVLWTKPIGFNPTTYKISKPRFEKYGLLKERAGNNLFLYSEEFTNAVWNGGSVNGQLIANQEIAPDGTNTATLFELVDAAIPWLTQGSLSYTSGNRYTASLYVKKRDITKCTILFYHDVFDNASGNNLAASFNLDTGLVESSSVESAGIEPIGNNGWYRIWASHTATASVVGTGIQLIRPTSSTIGEGTYIWGAQLEESGPDFATSYIPTTDSIGERQIDNCAFALDDNAPESDQALTFSCDFKLKHDKYHNSAILTLAYTDSAWDFSLNQYGGSETTLLGYYNGDQVFSHIIPQPVSELQRTLNTFNGVDTIKTFSNGTLIETNPYTPVKLSGGNRLIKIGENPSGAASCYGHISNIRIWDYALTEQEAKIA